LYHSTLGSRVIKKKVSHPTDLRQRLGAARGDRSVRVEVEGMRV